MRVVTLREARERVDRIRSVYAPEELRVETNFIAVLLPASLSLIASTALFERSDFAGAVLAFFAVYLSAILFDLAAITGRNFAARSLQEGIYRELGAAGGDESRALSEELTPAYDLVDAAAARRAYIPPMAKVLAAVMIAAVVWIIF